jgi:dTDP-4-dehydrorhamnose 3,5-epimerase
MKALPTEIPGVMLVQPRVFTDNRGSFVKTFHTDTFRDIGLAFKPREEFFSTSAKGVLRGMHFQLPPVAHDKLVYCSAGAVLDVVVDLRTSSGTFSRFITRELSAANHDMLFIPAGCAHGFLSLQDGSVMVYQTSTVHSPAHDAGILWNSIGFDWPVAQPTLSDRDRRFPRLEQFVSPF